MGKKKSVNCPKNIVIFGEMGAGKSSLINLIADKNIAKINLFDDGMQYNIFDTMGIENAELEPKEYYRSIKNASRLLCELDACGGTSLLVYCVKENRQSSAWQSNYQLFREVLYERQVPIVMVVTCLERETDMEEWWTRNYASLETSQIVVEGHACVTTLKEEVTKYRASKEAVRELIRQHATATPVSGGWKPKEGMISASMRRFKRPDPEDKKLEDKLQRDLV